MITGKSSWSYTNDFFVYSTWHNWLFYSKTKWNSLELIQNTLKEYIDFAAANVLMVY
jgi:hypothetical protein